MLSLGTQWPGKEEFPPPRTTVNVSIVEFRSIEDNPQEWGTDNIVSRTPMQPPRRARDTLLEISKQRISCGLWLHVSSYFTEIESYTINFAC